jgi:hypothetical protein
VLHGSASRSPSSSSVPTGVAPSMGLGPGARPPRMPISVVWAGNRLLPPRVRIAIQALEGLKDRVGG